MLSWIFAFLIMALLAAVLGFGGLAGAFAGIAKILFLVFAAAFVIMFVVNTMKGRSTTLP
ncbi:MAG: DUF1328 domain-containing protein [Deltaproteobacteria bacterium]|nr:MAG: DUF1328 domain-containing protein [Deltaproteobacteria bacterium]